MALVVLGIVGVGALIVENYHAMLLCFALLAVYYRVRDIDGLKLLKTHSNLTVKFLVVFVAVKLSDWLQGPYFYDVYITKRGPDGEALFQPSDVTAFFLTGFASGFFFSLVSGHVIDKWGRKLSSLLCALMMISSALSVYSNTRAILFFGRVCGGCASTLLYSALDAWLTAEAQTIVGSPEDADSDFEPYMSQINSLRV